MYIRAGSEEAVIELRPRLAHIWLANSEGQPATNRPATIMMLMCTWTFDQAREKMLDALHNALQHDRATDERQKLRLRKPDLCRVSYIPMVEVGVDD